MRNKLAVLLGLVLPAIVSVAEAGASDHRIWIETSVEDGRLLVAEPQVKAGHDARLDYEFISTKIGRAGRSNSTQSGAVQVAKGETRSFTSLRLSVAGDDQYILFLRVYENGQVVGEDEVTYP